MSRKNWALANGAISIRNSLPFTVAVSETFVQLAGVSAEFCCKLKPVEFVGQAMTAVLVLVKKILNDGADSTAGLNAASCNSHVVESKVAVAVKAPVFVAIKSSTMSESGEVIARKAKPLPGPLNAPAVMPAAKSSSLASLVETAPLLAVVPTPVPKFPASNTLVGLKPEYSVSRKST